MFIRIKRIKSHEYAYLVKNSWIRGATRQKVSRYLGRVHRPAQVREEPCRRFLPDDAIAKCSSRELILRLLDWVLSEHGFKKQGTRWRLDGIVVDQSSCTIRRRGRDVVIGLNNDYLCGFTLRRLLRFKSAKSPEQVGVALARAFVGAGIPVPEDVFVNVFEKTYKRGQSFVR